MDNDFKKEAQLHIETALKQYEAVLEGGNEAKTKAAYERLLGHIERANAIAGTDFNLVQPNSAQDVIDQLRFQLDRKLAAGKLQSIQCKCGKGATGKLGKRNPEKGVIEVHLKGGGKVECYDLGIGSRPTDTEVIAYIPSKNQLGFVDYKG